MSRQRTDVDSFSSVMGNRLSTNIFRIYIKETSRMKSEYSISDDRCDDSFTARWRETEKHIPC